MHLLLLKNGSPGARELYAWGGNEWGMLGNGTSGPSAGSSVPIRIGSALWRDVAAGYGHSLAVKSDGTLWAWGLNDNGQLGKGDRVDRSVPTQVGAAGDWVSVFCGATNSYAINASGDLYAWGYNDFGQLGLGTKTTRLTPGKVAGSGWAKVSTGPLDCLALKADGSLWAWGYNVNGQLGLPADYEDHTTPTRVGTATIWRDVACGPYHTVAATTDDRFAACGSNQYGQIGLGFPLYRCSPEQVGTTGGWLQVDASLTHGAGIRDDFSLWTWGYDIDGALGGSGGLTAPARVGFDNDWAAVSAGAYHGSNYTMAIKKSGTLWAFGNNDAGQLGLGDTASRAVPTQVGTAADWKTVACSDGIGSRGRTDDAHPDYTLDDHTLAIKTDGTLWAWGANDYGQLGLGTAGAADEKSPVQVGAGTDWAAVAAGDDYSAALKTDGTLWTWGRGQFGQLGHGSKAAVALPTQVTTGSGVDTFTAFACAGGRDSSHMLAVKTDGSLWGWGYQYSGELGQGTYIDYYLSPVRIGADSDWSTVACGSSYGDDFSLATKTSGKLYAWGGNFRGQLGGGDYVVRFDVGESAGGTWAGVVAGSNAFGLKTDGTLWAWGDNEWGQLGLGDAAAYSSTSVYPLADIVDTSAPTVETSVSKVAPATVVAAAAPGATVSRAIGGWTRTPRTIKVTATDAGSGVGRAQISLTGGVSYLTRNSVTVRNGDVSVYVRAIDRMGNTSDETYLDRWKIDTTRPKPAALGASVKRGSTAKLRYRIADYSPCTVKIAVKNARGKTVKTLTIRGARPMGWRAASFRCKLAKGKYRFYVTATDSVGYKQTKAAVAKLVVK